MATSVPVTIPLSGRKSTVLQLIAWGYTNTEIATRLGISVKTVEAHKANGMRKLQLTSRAGLVRQAVEWGWLTLERAPHADTDLRLQAVSGRRMDVRGAE